MKNQIKASGILALIMLLFSTSCKKDDIVGVDNISGVTENESKRIIIEEIGPIANSSDCGYAVYTDEYPGHEGQLTFLGIVRARCGISFSSGMVQDAAELEASINELLGNEVASYMEIRSPESGTYGAQRYVVITVNGYTFTIYNTTCEEIYDQWRNNGGITVNGSDWLPNNGLFTFRSCTQYGGYVNVSFDRRSVR